MAAKLQFDLLVNDKGTVTLKRFGKTVDQVAVKGGAFGARMSAAAKGIGSMAVKVGAFATAAAAGLAVFKGGQFAGDILKTGASFESLGVRLETIQGSAEKARASMKWIKDFTSTTPFELAEVSNAFVKLSAYGLDATQWMRTLGDTSSSMGKSLDQGVEMFVDALTGEFERLKEFGVKAKTAGDQVTFSWVQNGENMTKTVQKNATSIGDALGGIFTRFDGGMEKSSRTWEGMLSNLADKWNEFKQMIAESGFFQYMKDNLGDALAVLNEMTESGQLEAWAQSIGTLLTKIFSEIGFWIEYLYHEIQAFVNSSAFSTLMESAKIAGNIIGGAGRIVSGAAELSPVTQIAKAGGYIAGGGGSASIKKWAIDRDFEAARETAANRNTTVNVNVNVSPTYMTGDAAAARNVAREVGNALSDQNNRWN